MSRNKRIISGVLAVIGAVLLIPFAFRPSAAANAAEIQTLVPKYWDLAQKVSDLEGTPNATLAADHERFLKDQLALRERLHLLGSHIDDGEDACEWSGYLGAWRLFMGRLGVRRHS